MKVRVDTMIVLAGVAGAAVYSGWNGADIASISRWENSSVFLTTLYSIVVYTILIFGERNKKLTKWQKGIATTLTVVCIVISIPFCVHVFVEDYFAIGRVVKLWLLVSIAAAYSIIDVIMIRAGEERIKYKANLKYSEAPALASFTVLAMFAHYIDVDFLSGGDKVVWEAFFSGAIAFQMIGSNIVWALNDNALFKN